jgi:hypothetical protein
MNVTSLDGRFSQTGKGICWAERTKSGRRGGRVVCRHPSDPSDCSVDVLLLMRTVRRMRQFLRSHEEVVTHISVTGDLLTETFCLMNESRIQLSLSF